MGVLRPITPATIDRAIIEHRIETLIALLDTIDGDSDLEANGDELDGTAGEDDFWPHSNWRGEPGCPIADGDSEHDGREPEDWQ